MKRRFLLGGAALVTVLGLAACGFTPAYAPSGGAGRLTNAVRADDPSSRDGFDFVAAIESRFGVAAAPRFALAYQISVRQQDMISNRVHVIGILTYTLTETATATEIARGRVENFVAYSDVSDSTARVVSLPKTVADARLRLIQNLADQVALELVAATSTER